MQLSVSGLLAWQEELQEPLKTHCCYGDFHVLWVWSFRVMTQEDTLFLCTRCSVRSRVASAESMAGEVEENWVWIFALHLLILCLGRVPRPCAVPQFPFAKWEFVFCFWISVIFNVYNMHSIRIEKTPSNQSGPQNQNGIEREHFWKHWLSIWPHSRRVCFLLLLFYNKNTLLCSQQTKIK